MSLSTDVLARATPTRLVCRAGRWTLELTRLEAVDRDVFQPRLTRLEGSESILAALRRSEEGQHLASGAAQLMRAPRTEDDRAFEVSDGDWIPSADTGAPHRERGREPEAAETARAISELRAELAVLRASHARLRERVIALEPHPDQVRYSGRARDTISLTVDMPSRRAVTALDDDGEPFAAMRVPIPSLERPAFVEFVLEAGGGMLEYRLNGEARIGDGYICSYCGKLCPQKEPHTAAHGVAGHTHAGVAAGQEREPAPLTGPLELGHPGSGTQL